jgi:FSR family fosmidomycin resistance protein-like MFS transporter
VKEIGEKERSAESRLPYALAACFALSASMLTIFPIVSPEVVSELGLTYSEIGWIGAAYMLGYGVFQLPASLLGLRFGSARVLVGATALMSAGALLPCLSGGFAGWMSSRFIMGVGGAAVLPLSIHLLTRAMSGRRLVMGLSIFISGWGIGMTLAMLSAAPALHIWGWRAVLVIFATLGAVVLAALWWTLPGDARIDSGNRRAPLSLRRIIGRLGRNFSLNMMGIVNVAGTSVLTCVPTWLPLYLTKTFGESASEASAGLSPIGIAVAIGAWAGGALTLPLGWRRVVVASLIVSGLLVASISVLSSARLVVVTAILAGCVAMLFPAPIQSLFPTVMDDELVALGAGYFNTLGFIGAFCASLGFGYLVDHVLTFAGGWLFLASINVFGVGAALTLPAPISISSSNQS